MKLIVAVDSKNGIAKDGSIPWVDKSDLGFFKTVTYGSTMVMGRKTYDQIGALPGRKSIVISRTTYDPELMELNHKAKFMSFETYSAWKAVLDTNPTFDHFVVGGEQIYNLFLEFVKTVFITRVNGDWGCDKFFHLPPDFKKVSGFRLDTGSLVERYER